MAKPPIDLLLVLRRTSRARKPVLDDESRSLSHPNADPPERQALPAGTSTIPVAPSKSVATAPSTAPSVDSQSTTPTTTPAQQLNPLADVTGNYTTFKHVLRRQRIAAIARQYEISRLAEGHPCAQNDPPVFKRGKR